VAFRACSVAILSMGCHQARHLPRQPRYRSPERLEVPIQWQRSGFGLRSQPALDRSGHPCLFYGTEIRFKAGAEIDGTDAPHSTSGRAYFGDNLAPGSLDATRNHPMAKHLQRLNLIRRASSALQKGVMENFGDSDSTFWFARNAGNGQSYAVVGLAQSDASISVSNVKGGTYRDAVTGGELTASDGGTLTFQVKGGSAGIYLLNGSGKIGSDGAYLR